METHKKYIHAMQVIALALLLPCLYGCQGDGSSGGGSSSGAPLNSFAFSGGDDTGTTAGAELATIHNPEPATMLLLGSGIVAMKFARKRKNSLPRDQKR